MKKITTNIWAVLYPVAVYYVIAGAIFFALNLLLGEQPQLYMIKQMVCSGATIPFLYTLWKQDLYMEEVVFGKKEKLPAGDFIRQLILVTAGMACLGAALNNAIAMSGLPERSAGFAEANEAFFAGSVWMEIAASCIVVPAAEELLFRGIVLRRISLFAGTVWGIFLSALCFGLVHVNFVQFLYAGVLGIFLALITVKSRSVIFAVAGHAAANLIAIIRAETGILEFSYEMNLPGILFMTGMFSLGYLFLGMFLGYFSDRKE